MARAPKGTSIPKTSGQGTSRYSYQQAYKLRPNSPMGPGTKAKRSTGGLGAASHEVEDMADDRFAFGATDLFQNVWDSHKGKKDA